MCVCVARSRNTIGDHFSARSVHTHTLEGTVAQFPIPNAHACNDMCIWMARFCENPNGDTPYFNQPIACFFAGWLYAGCWRVVHDTSVALRMHNKWTQTYLRTAEKETNRQNRERKGERKSEKAFGEKALTVCCDTRHHCTMLSIAECPLFFRVFANVYLCLINGYTLCQSVSDRCMIWKSGQQSMRNAQEIVDDKIPHSIGCMLYAHAETGCMCLIIRNRHPSSRPISFAYILSQS